jgi:prenylcysteine oxidase/farnesylcysteine lyase
MKNLLKFVLFFFFLLNCFLCNNVKEIKVAIIGSGIAGSSAANYLLDGKNNIKVDLYEKSERLGGRIFSEVYQNVTLDHGAHFFILENKLIYDLVKELGLNFHEAVSVGETVGVFRGKNIFLEFTSSSKFITICKFLWRYWLSPIKVGSNINNLLKNFVTVYDILNRKETFSSLQEFVKKIKLEGLVEQSIEDYLLNIGVSQQYIDEIINALIAGIYHQHKEINAFAGVVNLIGANYKAYQITGGNSKIIQKLYEKFEKNSNFKLFKGKGVGTISKLDNGKFTLDVNPAEVYDKIIIAAPFLKTGINFININVSERNKMPKIFQTNKKTYIKGATNPLFFNLDNDYTMPKVLLSTNKTEIFGISEIAKLKDDILVFVSDEENYEKQIGKSKSIFMDGFQLAKEHFWEYAYPKLLPVSKEEQPDFVIAENIYYINAMEVAASCMEMEMISARNIVNIIENEINPVREKDEIDQKTEEL